MARIKLLTIHWGQSYGAVMQTYATSKLLEKYGHNVTVINIINPRLKWLYTKLRAFLCIIIGYQFLRFKKRYFPNLTSRRYSLKSTNLNDVDYVVVGSDQVWNRDITTPMDLQFFLKDCCVKKVSLSSSFGKNVWTEDSEYTLQVKELLNSFDALSVREYSGKEILEKTFGIESTVLVDPTLAYGNFEDLVLDNNPKKHIYTFFVNQISNYEKIVNEISAQTGLDVFRHTKFSYYLKNGPRHWLTYIKNSSCVITDSFHGVAFSIIFKKDFYVLCGEANKFDRVLNLLSLLGLEDRYISSIEEYEKKKNSICEINYEAVFHKLSVEQKRYGDFIQRYIK
ncbi:MAG: polysaccharide pyruvyl transferase family protein [Bacteroidaceae bacterium]|nr:polysaccharide pyruvyl transferase family protein [Bacteroidaceae bacterium]